MKNLIFLILSLNLVISAVYKDPPNNNLDCKVLVPVQKSITELWTKVLDEAYKRYLLFLNKLTTNLKALTLKRVGEFQISASTCFGIVKGKVFSKMSELELTMRSLNVALRKSIAVGICAIGELASAKLRPLYISLIQILERLEAASRLTQNFLQNRGEMSRFRINVNNTRS